jgi:formate dehydrogenase major subunit
LTATVSLSLDGKEIQVLSGRSILAAARANGVLIPTLCQDDQLPPLGACGLCVVAVEGYGLVRACSTPVAGGLVVHTRGGKVDEARRAALATLLGEHYGDCLAPCHLACPAGIDIQGYLALIARGAYAEAVELVKEALPLPATIGRVCPHPCEAACRRNLVDQPIAICSLKRFAADAELAATGAKLPEVGPPSGKAVAIIGAGPAGLSAAYYLRRRGHAVTIFEALPEAGGMLRYGIPAYRLPREILDREIKTITDLGALIKTGKRLGRDFTAPDLLSGGFDAVFLALGAHGSVEMGVPGESLAGVLPGIGFLRAVASGEKVDLGERVAVIGGGNTAIDAARTALRLGAKDVSLVYRRSRAEMPASPWEIEEAEEEGIHLHLLAAPVRVLGDGVRVTGMELIKMRLGEPDAGGRRRPEPLPGSEQVVPVDTIIAAIGQSPDVSALTDLKDLQIARGKVVADPGTLATGMKGVFAGGDFFTGPATAVEAIAAGRRAARSIDAFLSGQAPVISDKPYNVSRGELGDLSGREEFAGVTLKPRLAMPKIHLKRRLGSFEEIELGFPEAEARAEAARCLECGCKAVDTCLLREHAAAYAVPPVTAVAGRRYPLDRSHPHIERDPGKCIACNRCARICSEIQGVGALSVLYRVGTSAGPGGSLLDTNCESCGQCVTACPVGALVAAKDLRPARWVKTICPYCGVGCGIWLGVRGAKIVAVAGDKSNPVNRGNLCVKGRFGQDFINSEDRLTSPLIKRNGKFEPVGWDEALDLVAARLAAYKGPAFAQLASARCTNEDNYVIQKFARGVMQTNNIDHCARLCHAPSVAGLAGTLGSGAMTNSIGEIEGAACFLAIGTNTTSAHPVIALGMKKALRRGGRLIVANPRWIDLCRYADIWLKHRPGSDVALLMGMMRVIVDEGLGDAAFLESRCEGFDDFRASLADFDPATAAELTGVPAGKIAEAARLYASVKPASILYSMGITQHSHGTDNVIAVSNLALLTGNVGRTSSGVNPLRGQNNVQGACDMGALPNVLPGYQRVDGPELRGKFERAWGLSLSSSPGLTLMEIMEAAHAGQIKAAYIVGENPILSDADASHAREALENLEFLVVQDIFLTETAQLADVVLPGAGFAEKDGTFTNTERRVQRIRKAIPPVGRARPDWWIIAELARRMGASGFDYEDASAIMSEIATLVPIYGGITYRRIDEAGLPWPCPTSDHPGTPTLHTERFSTPNGKGRLVPLKFRPPAETPDGDYPLVLTTGRSLYHFHTGTMTRRVAGLNVLHPEELVEINPEDAAKWGIADGRRVRVVSRRGAVVGRALVTERSQPGVIWMTFHFAETPTNQLTSPALDPVAKIPELKVCAVRVEPVAD